ncbi:MAG: YtxH domain-containing protein [Chloroflexota bacterium]
MFSRVRIAIRFFFMGLAVGILLAPRSGTETRRLVRERADRILNDVLDAATLGTYDDGSASEAATAADAEAKAPKTGNGRGRASRATSTATTAQA